jgi:Raf kinase inhibitor-like YbhB/YbcL family protein
MRLTSSAFPERGEIPKKYTRDGQNISPPLAWEDVPPGTRSLALIVDDPDAPDPAKPRLTWVHWILLDLPPEPAALPEGVILPGRHHGLNDWNEVGWRGPAPPIGRHRYVFKLYALDRELGLDRPTKSLLLAAIGNAVLLAETRLIGTYLCSKAA